MTPKQAMTAMVIGIVLIALGLIPGIPGTLARLKDEMRHFSDSLSQSPEMHPFHSTRNDELAPGQIWWAVGGLALVALGLLALISN